MPVLHLADDNHLLKQTYVNLEHSFTIEADILELWNRQYLYLDDRSFTTLEHFINAYQGTLHTAWSASTSTISQYAALPQLLNVYDRPVDPSKFKLAPRGNCAMQIKDPKVMDWTGFGRKLAVGA